MSRARTIPLVIDGVAQRNVDGKPIRVSVRSTTSTTSTKGVPMSASKKTPSPALVATVLAASARVDPRSLHVDVAPGVAGVLVLFGPPATKPTPSTLRNAFADAVDRAGINVPDDANAKAATQFLATLPDVVSPVAALGLAVRDAVEKGGKWVHNGTVEKCSRWTYCSSSVTSSSVSIHGAGTCAEANADGDLTIDAGVPAVVAASLRTAYDASRGVVEPSRISAIVSAYLARSARGVSIASAAYLLPETTAATCAVLAGLSDLGGFAVAYAVADPSQIAALAAPVVVSIEEQIANVVKASQDFIARAVAVTVPGSTTAIQERSCETVRENIRAARKAATLWRERLNLAALDVDDALGALDKQATDADKAALKVLTKRREDAKLKKEVKAIASLD